MGFLSDLVEDVLETTEKIVRSPARIICAVDDHDWRRAAGYRWKCQLCAATRKRK